MSLRSKLAMNFGKSRATGGDGFGFAEVSPNSVFSAVLADDSFPLAALLDKVDSRKPGFVVSLQSLIASIFGIGSKPKVRDTVVVPNLVDVVYLSRPLAVNVKPRKVVSVIVLRLRNLYLNIALNSRSSLLPGISTVPFLRAIRTVFPPKDSGVDIVVENAAQMFGGKRRSFSRAQGISHFSVGVRHIITVMNMQPLVTGG